MRDFAIAPALLLMLCALWTLLANRRPRRTGVVWPAGFVVSGRGGSPDLLYPRDIVLGCEASFKTIHCRTLTILPGGKVHAALVVAHRVVVMTDGELFAEEIRAERIDLRAGSRSSVLVAGKVRRLKRHPKADARGFYTDRGEAVMAGAV